MEFHGNPGRIESVKKFDMRKRKKQIGLQAPATEKSCKRGEGTKHIFPACLSKTTAAIIHKLNQSFSLFISRPAITMVHSQ